MLDSVESKGSSLTSNEQLPSEPENLSLRTQTIMLGLTRIIPNTSVRMIYPFLSVFAQGLGIGLSAISLAMSFRSFLGMTNPILGSWVDRSGRKAGIQLGLIMLVIASVLVIFFPYFPVFVAYLCISYLGFLVVSMSIQSYIGDAVPYSKRGKVMSFVEMSWALSLIISMPLVAVLLAHWGWRAPFPLLGGFGLILLFIIRRYLPETEISGMAVSSGMLEKFKTIFRLPQARYALLYIMALSMANECVSLIFSVWISDSLGAWDEVKILPLLALGLASIIIGVAELCGEMLGGGLIDRLGKKRSILLGIICHAFSALLLPFLGEMGLWGAYSGLFMLYISFEFTMVASITMMSELMPAVRSTMLGTFLGATSCGRMLGAWLVPLLYGFGFRYNAAAAVIISLIALFYINRLRILTQQPAVDETFVVSH